MNEYVAISKRELTAKEKRQSISDRETAAAAGLYGGAAAGAYGSYKGSRGMSRVKAGNKAVKEQRQFRAQMDSKLGTALDEKKNLKQKLSSAKADLKTGAGVATKLPKSAVRAPTAGAAALVGAGVGGVGGAIAGQSAVDRHYNKKISKSEPKWKVNPKASGEEKGKYALTTLGGLGAAGGGGLAYGMEAGNKANKRSTKQYLTTGRPPTMKEALKNLGPGYKDAAKSTKGRVGLGAAAAGATVATLSDRKAKRDGTLIPNDKFKKNRSTSAFGVAHG